MKTASPAQILRFAYFTLAMLYVVLLAPAQSVPALVNYQGRLANPDGSPLPTADYTLTFKVFDAATNGALVWGPQVFDGVAAQGHGARIPVVQGYFNVMLGPVDTGGSALSDAFNGTSRYVEVTVSNRPPITPRQQILTTPFAFQAANSAKLAGYDWSAVFGTNNPLLGSIPGDKLADGTVILSKFASRPLAVNAPFGGIAISPSSGLNAGTIAAVPTDILNLSVTLVTSNRPVVIFLTPDVGNESNLKIAKSGAGAAGSEMYIYRDGTPIWKASMYTQSTASTPDLRIPPSCVWCLDVPGAGTHTYTFKASSASVSSSEFYANYVRLVAFEL
jgi:hypothetical protein